MKYTIIPTNTFKNLQLNAGILVNSFTPSTGVIGNILGATSGGNSFSATPTYTDYGDDIDNVPANMKELKKQTDIDVKMTGTFVTVSADSAKMLIGAADIDALDSTHIVPRKDIFDEDFGDIWFVGDYSDVNNGDSAGFVAIHMMNTLSTGGFALTSNDDGKGTFAYEFTAHFSMDAQDVVPYEIYIREGSGEDALKLILSTTALNIITDDTQTITVINSSAFSSVSATSSDSTVIDVTHLDGGIFEVSSSTQPADIGKSADVVFAGTTTTKTVYARAKVTIVDDSAGA